MRESGANPFIRRNDRRISTQSRAEAAALQVYCNQQKSGFNTQPREDGCLERGEKQMLELSFNTQPHGGGYFCSISRHKFAVVSTHSRPKAAAHHFYVIRHDDGGFNTQPPEGGCKKL